MSKKNISQHSASNEGKQISKIDRRWIFLFILLGVSIPLLIPFGFEIEVTPNVKMVYDLVNSAHPGDRILLSFDYDPASKPEIQPAAEAMIQHAIDKDLKIVAIALWPMGVSLMNEIYEKKSDNLNYGVNFINLGYTAGGMVAIQSMGRNFIDVFPRDANGDDVRNFDIMRDVRNFNDFSFVASFSSGTPGMREWIMVAGDSYGLPVTGSTTAVSTPGFLPYINEQRQLIGLIGGLKAAAEYEKLVGIPGTATAGMDAQSIAHLIIIIFIIIGNVAWYLNKHKSKKEA
ncbi:MAG: hypothetical protein FWG98_01600 [Candidatus Cloacimonetes bacterium]|nr:hypothetical protein [Candidatus Cloacimonadota bacterium]